jgi:secondary thiamine-phosphate synthase enzyme
MDIYTERMLIYKKKKEMEVIDLTEIADRFIRGKGLREGNLTIFVPGSTGAVSTIEYDPNLIHDFEKALERLAPSDIEYEHHKTWGDYNGKSHIRATVIGPSLTVPFYESRLIIGRWQSIVLIDLDVPERSREIILQAIGI